MPTIDNDVPNDDELVVDGSELALRTGRGDFRILSGFGRSSSALVNTIWELKPVLALAITYIVIVEVVLFSVTGSSSSGLGNFVDVSTFTSRRILPYFLNRVLPFFLLATMAASCWLLYQHLVITSDNQPLWSKILRLLKPLTRIEPWARLLVYSTIFIFFSGSFVSFKSSITVMHSFSWDPLLSDVDRMLHGGVAPWRLTWSIFGSSWGTHFLDTIYGSWFIVVYSAPLASLMFDSNRQRRTLFLISHLLLWIILGSAAALIFSSAGPCFFAPVIGQPGDFGPLMQNLRAIDQAEPLLALVLQNILWEGYSGLLGRVEGISAMPSLHIAQTVLLACLAHTYSRKLAVLAWGYAFLIFLGSVHLGWHYAVDGYAAFVMTVVLWWGMRKMVRVMD